MTRFFLFISILISSHLFAQKGTLSPYSYYGLGESLFSGTADQRSMGGLIAHVDSIHYNLSSPASLADLKLVNYSVGLNYSNRNFTSNNNSSKNETAGVDYLAVAIPTKFFGFGFGIIPKTAVGYRISVVDEESGVNYVSNYEGSGGINQAFFSMGFSPLKNLGLGIGVQYNFGAITKVHTRQDVGIDLLSQLNDRSEMRGMEWNFSTYYKFNLTEFLQLQLHSIYKPKAKLKSSNSRNISTFTTFGELRDTQDVNLYSDGLKKTLTDLPSKFIIGLGIGEPKKWYLGGQWSKNRESLDNMQFSVGEMRFESSSQLSGGGYFIPEYDSFSNYFKRIVYRLGFVSSKTGMILNNKSITNTGITFGVGLPVNVFSNVNIGIEYGKFGDESVSLIEENYFNIRIGFSLNDRWFIKRKFN